MTDEDKGSVGRTESERRECSLSTSEQMGRRSAAAAEAKMAKGIGQVKTTSDGNENECQSGLSN